MTDPNPTPQRQADLACTLLSALPAPVKHTVAERLLRSLEKPVKMAIFDKLAADLQLDGGDAEASKKGRGPSSSRSRRPSSSSSATSSGTSARGPKKASACCPRMVAELFVDEGGGPLFDSRQPRTGDASWGA